MGFLLIRKMPAAPSPHAFVQVNQSPHSGPSPPRCTRDLRAALENGVMAFVGIHMKGTVLLERDGDTANRRGRRAGARATRIHSIDARDVHSHPDAVSPAWTRVHHAEARTPLTGPAPPPAACPTAGVVTLSSPQLPVRGLVLPTEKALRTHFY